MKIKDFKLMDEKLLAIVDYGKEKHFFIVDHSDLQSFLGLYSCDRVSCPPPVIFQSVLVYDPIAFQSQLDFLNDKSKPISNPSNN